MYCPECGVEYREGFIECADCRVPLVPERPPHLQGDPDLEVITVLETVDPLMLAAAKGLLENAEISFCVFGDELAVRFGPTTPLIHPLCRIEVAADREVEAREVLLQLHELEQAGPLEEDQDPESPSESLRH